MYEFVYGLPEALGLSDDDETMLGRSTFLDARIRLWYWLRKVKRPQLTAEVGKFKAFYV